MSREIDYIGEGATDDAVARKLIESVSAIPGRTRRNPLRGNGKASLDRRLPGLNAGLYFGGTPILILRDLDNDAPCASALIAKLLKAPHQNLLFRICVRAAESWLMADTEHYASFCGVSTSRIPQEVDTMKNPKAEVVSWKIIPRGLRDTSKAATKSAYQSGLLLHNGTLTLSRRNGAHAARLPREGLPH